MSQITREIDQRRNDPAFSAMHNPEGGDYSESQIKHLTVNINLPAALAKLDRDLQHLVDLVSIGVTGVRKVEESEYKISPFASAQQLHSPLPYRK
jgi:hypothetical protein